MLCFHVYWGQKDNGNHQGFKPYRNVYHLLLIVLPYLWSLCMHIHKHNEVPGHDERSCVRWKCVTHTVYI